MREMTSALAGDSSYMRDESGRTNNNLSTAFLKRIGEYMLVETPLAVADACIVFGNNSHAVHLAEHAADLYAKGYFKTIVVTGGVPMKDGRLECDVMRGVLLQRSVPASAILVEGRATNTGENAAFSRALLEKTFGAGNVNSVLAIGHLHAARRFLMTLEKEWPQIIKMFSTTNCFKASKNLWYTDPAFKGAVLAEYAKIAPYKAQGFIAEIDLEKMKRRIAALPQPANGRKYHGGPHNRP